MNKTRNNHGEKPLVLVILAGVVLELLITLGGSLLASFMMNNDTWSENAYTTVSFITWIAAAFLGGILSGMIQRDRFWLMILLTSSFYILVLTSIAIMFFGGDLSSIGQGILAILIGSIPAFLICRPKMNQAKVRKLYHR